ncbi:hypothetical protein NIES4103_12490 [Nostoc sp. NIES-4103]|nr:hypothetical protein NIES4103_12490 [Nostoc sp. NIES-4103]
MRSPTKTQLKFILLWIAATFSGFLVSLLLIEVGEKPDVGVTQATLGGLAIALPQSLIFRHTVFSVKWILLTVMAWAVITAMGVGAVGWMIPTTQSLAPRLLFGTIYGAIGGLGIGVAQSLAIQQPVSSWLWIVVSSVSWAVAIPLGSAVGIILHRLTHLFLGEVAGLAVTWLVVAMLTGVNAYKLLK